MAGTRGVLAQVVIAAAVMMAAGCSLGDVPDAYGNVDATEDRVSAEVAGRLVAVSVT